MADQATLRSVNGKGSDGLRADRAGLIAENLRPERSMAGETDPADQGVVSNVAGFGENLLTLAELQTRLTSVEIRQNLESIKSGGAIFVAGVVLGVATIPVLMVGVAELLTSDFGMKRAYALLSVAGLFFAVAGACMGVARSWLVRNPIGFPLASEEFARNLNWLRTILRHSGRWPLRG
jgi:hypothetical protein